MKKFKITLINNAQLGKLMGGADFGDKTKTAENYTHDSKSDKDSNADRDVSNNLVIAG